MNERYTLRIAKTAEKDLLDLQAKQYKQVVSKILSLQGNPKPQDCKVLNGYTDGDRVDQGEYRILYTIDDSAKCESTGDISTIFDISSRII